MKSQLPKAAEQQTDQASDQHRLDRPIANESPAGSHGVLDTTASLLVAFRGVVAQLTQRLLCCVLDDAAHGLNILTYYRCLLAKPIVYYRHTYSLPKSASLKLLASRRAGLWGRITGRRRHCRHQDGRHAGLGGE